MGFKKMNNQTSGMCSLADIIVATAEPLEKPESCVQPLFTYYERPAYYDRSETVYASMKAEELYKRGFKADDVRSILEYLPSDVYLAGGSVASAIAGNDLAKDIDLFFKDGHAFEAMYKLLENPPMEEGAWALRGYTANHTLQEIMNDKSLRYVQWKNTDPDKRPIQMIKMVWFEACSDVIDSFDFTVTQFCMTKDLLVFNPAGLMDLFAKRLSVHKMQFPATTLRRLIKYSNKGFTANPSILLEIATHIKNSAELKDPYLDAYDH
jgi:hypothetical protein